MTLDIEKIRRETPGVGEGIHLLACGSALMPDAVVKAVCEFTELEARIGGYEAHGARARELDAVYDQVSAMAGASAREIALVENASVGWMHAFYALPLARGSRILTCEAEYAANYVAFLQRAKRDDLVIDVIANDAGGAVDVEALAAMIDDNVSLIAITWLPTNGGLVNPAAKIGAIAKKHNIPYLLDACQAVGQMPVNVGELGCDFLSATGRKFLRGPRGTGFLYVAEKWLDNGLEPAMVDHFGAPWVDAKTYRLRDDARRFETWENAYALRAGLGVAVSYARELGLAAIQKRSWQLADLCRQMLAELPGCKICDTGAVHSAIVSFSIDGLDPRQAVDALRKQGIAIGASSPESTLLDSTSRNLPTLLRAAPHYYNTGEELKKMVSALANAR